MSDYGIPIMISSRSRLAALLLAIFVGFLGIHRFYAGKVITGIIWLLTGGLLGIGVIVDVILIAIGVFRDKAGLVIQRW
ncbi:MAG: TM2 domain-containing protein [Candidatus Nanopelagicales bacterium]